MKLKTYRNTYRSTQTNVHITYLMFVIFCVFIFIISSTPISVSPSSVRSHSKVSPPHTRGGPATGSVSGRPGFCILLVVRARLALAFARDAQLQQTLNDTEGSITHTRADVMIEHCIQSTQHRLKRKQREQEKEAR